MTRASSVSSVVPDNEACLTGEDNTTYAGSRNNNACRQGPSPFEPLGNSADSWQEEKTKAETTSDALCKEDLPELLAETSHEKPRYDSVRVFNIVSRQRHTQTHK